MLEICRRKPESSHGGWGSGFLRFKDILIVESSDEVL